MEWEREEKRDILDGPSEGGPSEGGPGEGCPGGGRTQEDERRVHEKLRRTKKQNRKTANGLYIREGQD